MKNYIKIIVLFSVLFLFSIGNIAFADNITVTINNPLNNTVISTSPSVISTPIYNSSALSNVAVNIMNSGTVQDLIWMIPGSTPILKATYLPSASFIRSNTAGFSSPNVPLICNTNQDLSNYFRLPTGSIIFNGSCGPTPTPTPTPTQSPTPLPTPTPPPPFYVNGNYNYVTGNVIGSDTNDCRSKQTACATIGHALSLTTEGECDVIEVAPIYTNGYWQLGRLFGPTIGSNGFVTGNQRGAYIENLTITTDCVTLEPWGNDDGGNLGPVVVDSNQGVTLTITSSFDTVKGFVLIPDGYTFDGSEPSPPIAVLLNTYALEEYGGYWGTNPPPFFGVDINNTIFKNDVFAGLFEFNAANGNIGGTTLKDSSFDGAFLDLTNGGYGITNGLGIYLTGGGSGNQVIQGQFYVFNTLIDNVKWEQANFSVDEMAQHTYSSINGVNIENWVEKNSSHYSPNKTYIDFGFAYATAVSIDGDTFGTTGPLSVLIQSSSTAPRGISSSANVMIRYPSTTWPDSITNVSYAAATTTVPTATPVAITPTPVVTPTPWTPTQTPTQTPTPTPTPPT